MATTEHDCMVHPYRIIARPLGGVREGTEVAGGDGVAGAGRNKCGWGKGRGGGGDRGGGVRGRGVRVKGGREGRLSGSSTRK